MMASESAIPLQAHDDGPSPWWVVVATSDAERHARWLAILGADHAPVTRFLPCPHEMGDRLEYVFHLDAARLDPATIARLAGAEAAARGIDPDEADGLILAVGLAICNDVEVGRERLAAFAELRAEIDLIREHKEQS